ncbi:MAG: hydantoinase/oxoprolinase family protein [Desulfovibrionaceae bacterium]
MRLIGVDTGGTFTDFIYQDKDGFRTHKVLSTPDNPSRAVIQGLGQLARADSAPVPFDVVHGSTVATNAVLERTGAPIALLTNLGFEDVIEIGRQQRGELYDLAWRRAPALAPPERRFGVPGRMGPDGVEIEPLDPAAARAACRAVAACGARSVAVCLLFSFANPAHELALRALLAQEAPGVAVSLSHEILAEFREFERTSTTALNAYVAPIMDRYLADLEAGLASGPGGSGPRLRIMQSNGGSIAAATARREPVRTILSGPAGGAAGALAVAREAGVARVITFDMGGTSTDVCCMDGGLPLTFEAAVASWPVKTPMIDIHTVGAGGGSLAELDPGGALIVGPRSAGADPGPACYGRGGTGLTVTDADLLLGRLSPEHFLGGAMRLDPTAAARAAAPLAEAAGLSVRELAEGVVAVANSNMERALRVISVERGLDPRGFTLLSFGGAGGMHCAELARLLGMTEVLAPPHPGILSALGMILADVVKDYSRTIMRPAETLDGAELDELFAPLEARGAEELRAEGHAGEVRFERFLDMRYRGQSFELATPLFHNTGEADGAGGTDEVNGAAAPDASGLDGAALRAAFEALHQERFGHVNPGRAVEAVNLRLRVRGPAARRPLRRARRLAPGLAKGAALGVMETVFAGRARRTRLVDRAGLLPGNSFEGPAVVVEFSSTLVVPPGAICRVDELGDLRLTVA